MASKNNRDPELTRRKIKIAAKREFNSVGYFATDTNKIAKLAGYASGTFYRHFKDKIAIFIEIYHEWHLEQMSEIERTLALGGSIELMSDRLANIVINFYGNWKALRASARVLRISEYRVAEYHLERRGELITKLQALRVHLNLPPVPEENVIVFLILIERLGDAISDGDFNLLTLPPDSGKKALIQFISRFLRAEL